MLVVIILLYGVFFSSNREPSILLRQQPAAEIVAVEHSTPHKALLKDPINDLDDGASSSQCPYMSLSDLSTSDLSPEQGKRHMVNPPTDGKITLACCKTTAGPWSIAVHHNWAPLGAETFLSMVRSGYFSATVPLMRCVRGFLCQFGLTANVTVTNQYRNTFKDDPNWLPEGPDHRQNEFGVLRFAKGYLAYAGGGKDSRNNQFIVSLDKSGPLAGGSPWEVPWGELVGKHSFETLDKIYTGYGEDGPDQRELMRIGVTDETRQHFPKLDYVLSCDVVDETERA